MLVVDFTRGRPEKNRIRVSLDEAIEIAWVVYDYRGKDHWSIERRKSFAQTIQKKREYRNGIKCNAIA